MTVQLLSLLKALITAFHATYMCLTGVLLVPSSDLLISAIVVDFKEDAYFGSVKGALLRSGEECKHDASGDF